MSFTLSTLFENLISDPALVRRSTATSLSKGFAIFNSQIPGWEKSGYKMIQLLRNNIYNFYHRKENKQSYLSSRHAKAHGLEGHSKTSESERPKQPLTSQDYGEGIKGDIYKALSATSGI